MRGGGGSHLRSLICLIHEWFASELRWAVKAKENRSWLLNKETMLEILQFKFLEKNHRTKFASLEAIAR